MVSVRNVNSAISIATTRLCEALNNRGGHNYTVNSVREFGSDIYRDGKPAFHLLERGHVEGSLETPTYQLAVARASDGLLQGVSLFYDGSVRQARGTAFHLESSLSSNIRLYELRHGIPHRKTVSLGDGSNMVVS